jgi:EmrB/QacA subfamily drug resistance transporter
VRETVKQARDGDPGPRYKWVVLGIAMAGVVMVGIDTTVVVLALPTILADLHSNLVTIVWVLMAYIFVSTVFLLALGRVADIYGRVRLYNAGFAVFTVGSAFCGFAQSDWQLIAARVVQGIGGALLLVNAFALITEAFPPNERGGALGALSATFGAGGIFGPILGGLLLSVASWRWIFFINVPIGIVATIVGYRVLAELSQPKKGERLDVLGVVVFTFSLLALLAGILLIVNVGIGSPVVLGLFAAFALGLAAFLYWEGRAAYPALDPVLFRSRVFDFSVLAAALQSLAIFSLQFLVVFYLQAVRGYSPLTAALLLLPFPVALSLVGPFAGRLSDRIGARAPATVGLLVQVASLEWLATIGQNASYTFVAIGLGLAGLGAGLFFSPNTSAALTASPRDRLGVASATLTTLRNCGTVTSYALALTVAASAIPRKLMLALFLGTSGALVGSLKAAYVTGMHAALHVGSVICIAAALMSLVRGKEDRSGPAETPPGRTEHPTA